MMKDELRGKITQFAALGPKTYRKKHIYLTNDRDENKLTTSIKMCVIKRTHKFED